MSIIWYLLTHYSKFSSEALVGFSFIGFIEMLMELMIIGHLIHMWG